MANGIIISNAPGSAIPDSRPVSSDGSVPQKTGQEEARPAPATPSVSRNVLPLITKSVERRLEALSIGSMQDFLHAAEKVIEASLPNQPPGTRLRIDLDDNSGRFVYQGVDIATGDVVTQFPSEDILRMIAFSRERDGIEGIILDEQI